MKIVVISPEGHYDEIPILIELFQEGLENFHLRKPTFDEGEVKRYLSKIPQEHHNRIILHSFHHLAHQYSLKGIHFPEKARLETNYINSHLQTSSSFHNLDDLKDNAILFEYVFLSPVFNSISKQGYESSFSYDELKNVLPEIKQCVIALGGVDEGNIKEVKRMGFKGIALLGAIWNSKSPLEKLMSIKKLIEEE